MQILKKIKQAVKQYAGWSRFESSIKPDHNFGNQPIPNTPDYSDLANWFAHPKVNSKVQLTPDGIAGNTAWKEGEVDVFFIYPTLNFSKLGWNAPLDHASTNELVREMIMSGQASVFNSCCRIFSPKYRQATFYSFLGAGKNGRKALELAYDDCLKSFDYYIKHLNNGRPFFLAGHSQGALHIMRLIDERIEKTELAKRMVAAYPIGFWFPVDKFGKTLTTVKPAESPTDINCVVAYDTFLEGGGGMRFLDRAEIVYSQNGQVNWQRRSKKKPLGVNPLSWKRDLEKVSAKENLGAVHLKIKSDKKPNWAGFLSEETLGLNCTGLSVPKQEECTARIGKDGFLYVSNPKNWAFKNMVMPGGNLHMSDFSLFYMNLRENIETRWNAYRSNNG